MKDEEYKSAEFVIDIETEHIQTEDDDKELMMYQMAQEVDRERKAVKNQNRLEKRQAKKQDKEGLAGNESNSSVSEGES